MFLTADRGLFGPGGQSLHGSSGAAPDDPIDVKAGRTGPGSRRQRPGRPVPAGPGAREPAPCALRSGDTERLASVRQRCAPLDHEVRDGIA
ncbi:hypothetical protein GCM10010371_47360 [Streptomyces subrutilus]|uniref:Uncharacterized protein n=1 Tax=Streptomyces subrutilus TaxID=36818 RepID=A0A918R0B5_9ACTN|nr:hypothetical protein GCM10010371_47360 [Streptomyces subrutilus]